MYRAVAFAALRRGVDPDEPTRSPGCARSSSWRWTTTAVRVDGVDATIEIRGPEVTRAVSIVAANPGVREEMRRASASGPPSTAAA